MKRLAILIAIIVVTAAAVFAGVETNRFYGGSSDGYGQTQLIQYNEADYLELLGSRFQGGSFDGYQAIPARDILASIDGTTGRNLMLFADTLIIKTRIMDIV